MFIKRTTKRREDAKRLSRQREERYGPHQWQVQRQAVKKQRTDR